MNAPFFTADLAPDRLDSDHQSSDNPGQEDDCGRAQSVHQVLRAIREERGALTTTLVPPSHHPCFRDLTERSDPRHLMEAAHQFYMVHLQRTGRRSAQRPTGLLRSRITSGVRLEPGITLDARLTVTSRKGRSIERDLLVVEVRQRGRLVGRVEATTLLVGHELIAAKRATRRLRLPDGQPCVDTRPSGVCDPRMVGRARRADVLLEEPPRAVDGGFAANLLVPYGLGYFFDPPVDHVHGASLLDAFLQLRNAAGWTRPPSRVDISFLNVCETDAPCLLTLEPTDGPECQLSARQGSDVVARATVAD